MCLWNGAGGTCRQLNPLCGQRVKRLHACGCLLWLFPRLGCLNSSHARTKTTHREHCSCSPRRSKSLPTRLPTRVAKLAAFHNSRINLFLSYNLDVMMVRPNKVLKRIKPKCFVNCLLWKLREASASATFETRKEHLAGASTSPVDRPKQPLPDKASFLMHPETRRIRLVFFNDLPVARRKSSKILIRLILEWRSVPSVYRPDGAVHLVAGRSNKCAIKSPRIRL